MLYFDTSFLVPLFLPEESSERVDHFFQQLPVETELVVSHWTRVEFASVLSRFVRVGEMKKNIATLCGERFETLLAENLQVVLPGTADYNLCWKFLTRFDNSLRASDALHLAIASNLEAETIFTLDNGMLKDGRLLGLPVARGIE